MSFYGNREIKRPILAVFTSCKPKAHIYTLVQRVILNFGEGAGGFEDNVFDCSLLYFSSSLSSLFVSLTNPEKPSARVGGGAVRQSLDFPGGSLARCDSIGSSRPGRAPAALALAPPPRQGLTGTACLALLLQLPSQGTASRARRQVCLPGMPLSKVGCHSTVVLKENGIVAPGERSRRRQPRRNRLQGEGKEGEMDGEQMKFPVPVPALSGGTGCTPGATGLGNSSHSCDF